MVLFNGDFLSVVCCNIVAILYRFLDTVTSLKSPYSMLHLHLHVTPPLVLTAWDNQNDNEQRVTASELLDQQRRTLHSWLIRQCNAPVLHTESTRMLRAIDGFALSTDRATDALFVPDSTTATIY